MFKKRNSALHENMSFVKLVRFMLAKEKEKQVVASAAHDENSSEIDDSSITDSSVEDADSNDIEDDDD